MSRRAPNPAAERAAQNQATIKSLLKLEPNKVCADCKRNKHPRWASWNLGVFICIRCSGIHRGMGTHISRVKSVDLDSWTDEQMQSILSWGNSRANKYWESKLAPGHVPSESKIENFIRTKYELKRWAMEGPRPDPSTLDAEGDDDVPLSVVKEKQAIERSESQRKSSASQPASSLRKPPAAPEADLIGGVDTAPPRSSTTEPPSNRGPANASKPPAAKPTSTNSSLLGLDFFGEPAAPQRPASTTGVSSSGGQSRPDLKQSILSLYASAPKPQPQQHAQHQSQGSFGSMGSPPLGQQPQSPAGGFNDAFGSLSISNTAAPKPAAADPFASLGSASSRGSIPKPASNSSFGGLGGGSFFDSKPAQPSAPVHQQKPSNNSGFGDFGAFASPTAAPTKPAQPASSATGDLFDLSAPMSQTTTSPPPTMTSPPPASSSSVFNLSAPQKTSPPLQPAPKSNPTTAPAFGAAAISGADVWGGNEWASTEPAAPAAPAAPSNPPAARPSGDFGWGASGGSFASTPIIPGAGGGFKPAPKVAADEEFGGWASSTGPSSGAAPKPPAGGFGGADDDLFSNVWQ